MAWAGMDIQQAAEHAGVTAEGLEQMLDKPGFKQAYIQAVEEFRTSQIARAVHRLVYIMNNSDNHMASINAAKLLLQPIIGHEHGKQTTPGVVIQVMDTQTTDKATQVIDNATGPTEPDHT